MAFAGINYLAVGLAAVAGYAFGALWYMMLARVWLEAIGKTEEQVKAEGPKPAPFIIAFLANLIMAWSVAGILGHMSGQPITVVNGLIAAAFLWFGFVITTLVTNHQFQGTSPRLTLVDGGHWLGVLLIHGAIIGWFGTR
jgi:hypothetical protein